MLVVQYSDYADIGTCRYSRIGSDIIHNP